MTTQPTPPIELLATDGVRGRWPSEPLSDTVLRALSNACPTTVDPLTCAETSRDWWPLALHWALAGEVPALAAAVCRPTSTAEVAAVATVCNDARVPLTVTAGRSGVTGASVPVLGGVALDVTGLAGLVSFDAVSGVAELRAGTFGPDAEAALAEHDASIGHSPQSFDLATVGGWIACRGAGQHSTRYGKIESMVVGLEVVLADGRVVHTGGSPAAAVGPDLSQLFIGSEGTLGIVTTAWLRTHRRPEHERRAAYSFDSFAEGIDACRATLQRRRHARRAAAVRRRRVGGVGSRRRWHPLHAAGARRGHSGAGRGDDVGRRPGLRRGPGRTGRRSSTPGSSTATTPRPCRR